jgi:di/tricarboxylate transporter
VVAFLLCVIAFISIKVLNGNLYRNIEWPVVVMLAAMIPVGQALETSGISLNIANFISSTTEGMALALANINGFSYYNVCFRYS